MVKVRLVGKWYGWEWEGGSGGSVRDSFERGKRTRPQAEWWPRLGTRTVQGCNIVLSKPLVELNLN